MTAYAVVVRRGGNVLHDDTVNRLIEADQDFCAPFVYNTKGDADTPCTAEYVAEVVHYAIGRPGYAVTVEAVTS